MLAELLGTDELRDLLDAGVLEALEAELQCLDERRVARGADAVADILRRLGDLTPAEVEQRCAPGVAGAATAELLAARRVVPVRLGGEERLIVVEDAGRYRDGLGALPPPGLADAFLEPVPDALVQLVRRWARVHGPFTVDAPAARFGLATEVIAAVLVELAADGRIERGAFRPGGRGNDEWCDTEVLRLLRQRSLAVLRNEVAPAETGALARFLPAWHGVAAVGRTPGAGGLNRLYEVIGQIQGLALPASTVESDILPVRVRGYQPRMLDELLASGEVMWVGAGSLGRSDGRVVLGLREHAPLLWRRLGFAGGVLAGMPLPPGPAVVPSSAGGAVVPAGGAGRDGTVDQGEADLQEHLRQVLAARGACFFRELGLAGRRDQEILDALWDLVWAGEVTSDVWAALRATVGGGRSGSPRRTSSRSGAGRPGPGGSRPRPRMGSVTTLGPPRGQGRWSLVERELGPVPDPTAAGVAVAGLLLERHGVLTRESVCGEGLPGGFAGIYPVLRTMEEAGRIRRGYFVAGMGGAQFALPGAVDRLRAVRDPGTPVAEEPGDGWAGESWAEEARGDGRAGDGRAGDGAGEGWAQDSIVVMPTRHAAAGPGVDGSVVVMAATDPANVWGAGLPWPAKGPTRVPGAYVVIVDGVLSLYVERGGRGLVATRDLDGTWEERAVGALTHLVATGRWSRLALQRWPAELDGVLREARFTPTPKGLVHYGAAAGGH